MKLPHAVLVGCLSHWVFNRGESSLGWQERPHDDLVLACAIAAWQGEKAQTLWLWGNLPRVIHDEQFRWQWWWCSET